MSRKSRKRTASEAGLTDEEDSMDAIGTSSLPTPTTPTEEEVVAPPVKRQRKQTAAASAHHPTHSRALEWFYDLIDSANYPCVSWRGTQGHFVIHDAQSLLDGIVFKLLLVKVLIISSLCDRVQTNAKQTRLQTQHCPPQLLQALQFPSTQALHLFSLFIKTDRLGHIGNQWGEEDQEWEHIHFPGH